MFCILYSHSVFFTLILYTAFRILYLYSARCIYIMHSVFVFCLSCISILKSVYSAFSKPCILTQSSVRSLCILSSVFVFCILYFAFCILNSITLNYISSFLYSESMCSVYLFWLLGKRQRPIELRHFKVDPSTHNFHNIPDQWITNAGYGTHKTGSRLREYRPSKKKCSQNTKNTKTRCRI